MITNKIEKAFWKFHEENPHVYVLFDRFANEVVRAGRDVFSVSLIIERIRWYTNIETHGDDFKINNNFRAYYARLWMKNNPQHNGLFRIRQLLAGQESEALTINEEQDNGTEK